MVILYEDFATGLRARRVGGILAEALRASGRFEPALWRWDVLQDPQFQRRAVDEVARADLLIVSVHRRLPAVPLGALLDAWLAAKARRASHLVALVDGTGARGSVAACLWELARRRGLDCLVSPCTPASSAGAAGRKTARSERKTCASFVFLSSRTALKKRATPRPASRRDLSVAVMPPP